MLYYRTLQIYHLLFVGTFLCTVSYMAINRKLPFFPMQSFFRLIEKFLLAVCNL